MRWAVSPSCSFASMTARHGSHRLDCVGVRDDAGAEDAGAEGGSVADASFGNGSMAIASEDVCVGGLSASSGASFVMAA